MYTQTRHHFESVLSSIYGLSILCQYKSVCEDCHFIRWVDYWNHIKITRLVLLSAQYIWYLSMASQKWLRVIFGDREVLLSVALNMDPTHLDLLSREYGFHFTEITHTDINSSPPGQNGRHFQDDIFRCIFVNEKFCVLIKNHADVSS